MEQPKYIDKVRKYVSESEINLISQYIKDGGYNIKPKPYQITGCTYMLKNKTCINADDMGLGKTFQAILTTEVAELFPCLVIAPGFLKYNWEKQWNRVNIRNISVASSTKINLDAEVIIINYDILARYSAQLSKIKFRSLVVDESHFVKNSKAQRSKAVYKISKKIEYKFLLSGTPVLNKPAELVHQLKILGIFDKLFIDWKKFIYRYCNAKKTRFGLDYSGASNLIELNEILRLHCLIRRKKNEVMADLPKVTENIIEIETDNKAAYNKAASNITEFLFEYGDIDAAVASTRAEVITMLNVLKRLTIEGKLKNVELWLRNFLESNDKKLVIFGVNTAPLEYLAKIFKGLLITGSTNITERQIIVERFQNPNTERFLFGNISSIGTGVDGLQNICSDALVLQLPDTPAALWQAISRLDRIGQKEPVSINYAFAEHGIDFDTYDILQEKKVIADSIVDGGSDSEIEDITMQLLKRLQRIKK